MQAKTGVAAPVKARACVVKAHSRLSQGSDKVRLLGLETLNWGAGTLVTAAMEAEQLKERRRQ